MSNGSGNNTVVKVVAAGVIGALITIAVAHFTLVPKLTTQDEVKLLIAESPTGIGVGHLTNEVTLLRQAITSLSKAIQSLEVLVARLEEREKAGQGKVTERDG